ncbi:hypothetical protein [Nitrosococcus watsonii]|uniref:Uncharacterized protein n=1 Tax=Nitrosococcus watsoni (strain C-113) TaxID=105559 RepID=D8K6L6_NITWC|nr:hypothetical protein [Nitrosococcus watsonii]ADJ28543.1 conserved hypothetical protein [Nitrosococcus watsonii C-113]
MISQNFPNLKMYYVQKKLFFTLAKIAIIFIYGLFILSFMGCSATRSITETERTFLEQVLITQSVKSSLNHAKIPLPDGASVQVRTSGLTEDQYFAIKVFEAWLGQQGYKVIEDNADYVIRVVWHGIGTGHNEFFFGFPPINSTLIPFSTPELSFYKAVEQDARTRLSISIIKKEDGQFVSATPAYEGKAYYAVKTFLFGFTFESTNLAPPPPE